MAKINSVVVALTLTANVLAMPNGAIFAAPAKAPAKKVTPRRPAPASPPKSSTLEENYARLCATPGKSDPETCDALKKAMIAKLTGSSAATVAPPPPVQKVSGPRGFGLTVRPTKDFFPKGEVLTVESGSPAAEAGFKVGDKLIKVERRNILGSEFGLDTQANINNWLKYQKTGVPQRIQLDRQGEKLTIEMNVDPAWASADAPSTSAVASRGLIGGASSGGQTSTASTDGFKGGRVSRSSNATGAPAELFGDLAPYLLAPNANNYGGFRNAYFIATQTKGKRNRGTYPVKFEWMRDKGVLYLRENWVDSEWGPFGFDWTPIPDVAGAFLRSDFLSPKEMRVRADGMLVGQARFRNENGFSLPWTTYKRVGDVIYLRLYDRSDPGLMNVTEEYVLRPGTPEAYEVAASNYQAMKRAKKEGGSDFLNTLAQGAVVAAGAYSETYATGSIASTGGVTNPLDANSAENQAFRQNLQNLQNKVNADRAAAQSQRSGAQQQATKSAASTPSKATGAGQTMRSAPAQVASVSPQAQAAPQAGAAKQGRTIAYMIRMQIAFKEGDMGNGECYTGVLTRYFPNWTDRSGYQDLFAAVSDQIAAVRQACARTGRQTLSDQPATIETSFDADPAEAKRFVDGRAKSGHPELIQVSIGVR